MDSSAKYEEFKLSAADTKKDSRKNFFCLIVTILFIIALIVAIILAVAVGVGITKASDPVETPSGLTITVVTQEELKGEYHGIAGGIRFHSVVNSTYVVISVTRINGEVIIVVIHPVVLNMTMVSVNSTNFMIMENRPGRPEYDDYIVPDNYMDVMESIMMGERSMSDEVLRHLDNTTVNETRQSVLYELSMSQEALLIIEAAQSLGNRGVQGSQYLAVMHFYQLALQLANARGSVEVGTTSTSGTRQTRVCSSNGRVCPMNRCPSGSRCFGQCGHGCYCWSFVCGDCCVHEYCESHDQCCKDKGFWSWPCFRVGWDVRGSRCSQTYRC